MASYVICITWKECSFYGLVGKISEKSSVIFKTEFSVIHVWRCGCVLYISNMYLYIYCREECLFIVIDILSL
jgi:hypothetical protein